MIDHPEDYLIASALAVAALSPCRSKRGVVLYDPDNGAVRGLGHNGPPASHPCPGRSLCSGTCGQLSVHAEIRALREAAVYVAMRRPLGPFDLLHVELAADGGVFACDGPGCWQCSREILDVGFVGGVWLYERAGCPHCEAGEIAPERQCPRGAGGWRRYAAGEFHRVTLARCGIALP